VGSGGSAAGAAGGATQSPRAAAKAAKAVAKAAKAAAASAAAQGATPAPPGAPEVLVAPVVAERVVLGLVLAVCGGCGYAFSQQLLAMELAGAGGAAALAFLMLFFVFRYGSLPQVRRLRNYADELAGVDAELVRSGARAKALAEIDGFSATARRLDFEELADRIGAGEGQEVLDRIMEFLEDQAVSTSPLGQAEPDLGRKLARRGLKNALRLSDVIVSRSMATGETTESLTVVLRGGKEIADPALTRQQAEALLVWRGTLEKEFVAKSAAEELVHHDALTKRAAELNAIISLHEQVNAWRFLGLVLGVL
jgi:hypothetical protein